MSKDKDVLAEFRYNFEGDVRGDFIACLSALNAQADAIVMAHHALDSIFEDLTDNEQGAVVAGVLDTLKRASRVMAGALDVLADCEVAR